MREYEIKYNEYEPIAYRFLGVKVITVKIDTESNAIDSALKILKRDKKIATLISIERIPKETDENFWKDHDNPKRKIKKINC